MKKIRRFFSRIGACRAKKASTKKATRHGYTGVSAVVEEVTPVTVSHTNEPSHIEVETVIQHADEVIAHAADVLVTAQDAEIHAEHAEVDAEHAEIQAKHADVHTLDANVRSQHANIINPQNVQVNQEIDTLIQHTDEVHAEGAGAVIHAENVGNIQGGVINVHMQPREIPELSEEDINKLVKEFCESVKTRSQEETSGGVADSYREQNLTEPGEEYTPQLKNIKFYRGGWIPKEMKLARGQKVKNFFTGKKLEKENEETKEYVKENVLTLEENHKEGDDISKHEILQFIEDKGYASGSVEKQEEDKRKMDSQRYKAIVGQAGSGKTTLMKRLARDVIHGKLSIREGENEPFKSEFVHYLNIRDIPVEEKITPCDLLFGKVMASVKKDSIIHGFEWLQNNQDKAVFFFDGLDQATWSLHGNSNPIRYEDEASTSTIMENLLEGNLFPNVLIIISSREHALSPLKGSLRPHQIIGLAGFTMEDRKQVFIGLAGEDGENLWNVMYTKSPALVLLSSIPIFLVFIVIVYKFDKDNPPDTMSGVITKILEIFMQSEHAHESDNIMKTLEGLKRMAFKGTKEGRVLFKHKDLKEFNLIPKSVRDLVVFVPGSTMLGKNLMDGHFRLFFCHQSIQELLTALCIIEKDLEAFTKFVNESLHDDHWSVVRRFVCGVLLNDETYNSAKEEDLIDVSEVHSKKEILKRSLSKQLQKSSEVHRKKQILKQSPSKQLQSNNLKYRKQLELFASLYESNDSEFIQSNVTEINIENQTLAPNDMHVISSVLRRCSEVTQVKLKSCSLNSETVNILNEGLQSSQVKINRIDVSENDITDDMFIVFCSIIRQCQVKEIVTDDCTIEEVDGNSKVGRLSIERRKLGVQEMSALGSVLRHYDEMDEVVMESCELQADGMKCFLEAVGVIKIKILDVSGNENMGTGGCKTIGSIVYKCQVEELNMRSCNLSTDEINGLQEGLADSKIKVLEYDVPYRPSWDYVQAIVDLVHLCHPEKFVLWHSVHLSSNDEVLIKRKALDTEVVFEE